MSIFDAVERGDLGRVWQLVRSGVALDALDEASEMTALAVAAEAGHAEIAQVLIEAGANLDDGGVTTPLEAAVVEGHLAVADALLAAGADVNRTVDEGFTPLMTAALTGDLKLIDMLLAAGAKPRQRNAEGDNAISLARDAGHEAVATRLISWRRPKTVTAGNGRPAGEAKAGRGTGRRKRPAPKGNGHHPPLLEATLEIVAEPPVTATPIVEAVAPSPAAGALAAEVPQPPAEDDSATLDTSPLIRAAAAGQRGQVAELIADGAELEEVDGEGYSALFRALDADTPDRHLLIAELAAAGADPKRRVGSFERTLLMHAIVADVMSPPSARAELALSTRAVLELGVDLEARDGAELTAWQLTKRNALAASTASPHRRRWHQMLRVLEQAGAEQTPSHAI